MSKRIIWFPLVGALLFAGCNGPKDSCEGSYKSYVSMLEGKDWEGIHGLLTPAHKKKFALSTYSRAMEELWGPTKGFEWRLNTLSETKNVCIVNGMMEYTWKVRGKEPEDREEYYSFTFRKDGDGKWYIEAPGAEKVAGW